MAFGKPTGLCLMRFEPTDGLWRKSTVYGLNGHRAYYIYPYLK